MERAARGITAGSAFPSRSRRGGGDGRLGIAAWRQSVGDPQNFIVTSVFVSLAHEMLQVDGNVPHYGLVSGLQVGIKGSLQKC